MSTESKHAHRKDEHLAIATHLFDENQVNAFDQVRLLHQSLPEIAVADIHLETELFGKAIAAPIYINAMTGGSKKTGQINGQLAQIAAELQIPMAVGSESIVTKEPASSSTFEVVRKFNPNGVVFANMSADKDLQQIQAAIDLLAADALQIHLNVIQEAVMPEGERTFYWADNLSQYQDRLDLPIIVKEVGFGMNNATLHQLQQLGIQYIDVSGTGGTNFAKIENVRRPGHDMAYLAGLGNTTVESLLEARQVQGPTYFASGGIRNPYDIVKAWRLGAQMVGMSGTILHLLLHSGLTQTITTLKDWLVQLKLLLAIFGARDILALRQTPMVLTPDLISYCQQRQIQL